MPDKIFQIKFLLFSLFCIPTILFGQHRISGTFSPASDYTYAFLYKSTPEGPAYMDRSELTEDGYFEIKLDSSVTSGIYKIVYATPPEEFNFNFMYNGKENVVINFDTDKGLEFVESEDNKLWASYTHSLEMVNRTISNYYTQKSENKKAFADIFKTLKDTQKAYEEASKGKLSHTFITSNRPYIPESYQDLSTYSKHLRSTFLDSVDFTNPLLQSSEFLLDRSLAYVLEMPGVNGNDDYKKSIKALVSKMDGVDPNIKTTILVMIWERFADMDNKEVSYFMIDNYLLDLANEIDNGSLADQLNSYRNTSIGAVAPDFEFGDASMGVDGADSLHSLKTSDNYLLIFWSSTCSHCLNELPKVKKLLEEHTDIKVVAFGLEDDDKNWKKEISKYPEFIHLLGLEKWDNSVAGIYGISGTPSYFMLNSDKEIIAKPFDFEALEQVLNMKE